MLQVLVLMLLAGTAEADLKQIKKEMLAARTACGADMACQNKALQDGMARLKAATAALQSERAGARDEKLTAANAERDRHGGKSGSPDGQYLGFPDAKAVEAALKSKHCLHDVTWDVLHRKLPPPRQAGKTPWDAPRCEAINIYEKGSRYCELNRVALAWAMGRHWGDRYWGTDSWGKQQATIHDSNCLSRAGAAFRISKDVGFRLAVLDFITDVRNVGSEGARPFIEKALEKEPAGPVRQRLEWLAGQ